MNFIYNYIKIFFFSFQEDYVEEFICLTSVGKTDFKIPCVYIVYGAADAVEFFETIINLILSILIKYLHVVYFMVKIANEKSPAKINNYISLRCNNHPIL